MIPLHVFYDSRQNVAGVQSLSPSASKPRLVYESWISAGLPMSLEPFEALSPDLIELAHEPEFVRQILTLIRKNGFGNMSPLIAQSLLWTSGAMAASALFSEKTRKNSVALVSGFHHAGYDFAQDFCTFNGLVIAAQLVRLECEARRVGILDCDVHFANGTVDIIKRLNLDFIRHWSFGANDITVESAEAWLNTLPSLVRRFRDCEVLIYQAGADPHINDPLGGV